MQPSVLLLSVLNWPVGSGDGIDDSFFGAKPPLFWRAPWQDGKFTKLFDAVAFVVSVWPTSIEVYEYKDDYEKPIKFSTSLWFVTWAPMVETFKATAAGASDQSVQQCSVFW